MNDFDLLTPPQKAWVVECFSSFPEYGHYAAAATLLGCAHGQGRADGPIRLAANQWTFYLRRR